MIPWKRILILGAFTCAIIIFGKILPIVLKTVRPQLSTTELPKKKAKKTVASRSNSDSLIQKALFDSLASKFGLKYSNNFLLRSDSSYNIFFQKGRSLYEYANDVQGYCHQIGITVEDGWISKTAPKFIRFKLTMKNSSVIINIRHGRSVIIGSAKLCVVITNLENVTGNDISLLNQLDWPKTIVVNPHSNNDKLKIYARTTTSDCVLLSLPMEPHQYPYKKPGKNALFIHYEKAKINELLNQKLQLFPNAAGFCSAIGDRAVENDIILNNLFRYLSKKKLGFLDLIGSQRSLSTQISRKFETLNRQSTEINASIKLTAALTRKLALAIRKGEALLVVRYRPQTLKIIDKSISRRLKSDKRLSLITFSELEKL